MKIVYIIDSLSQKGGAERILSEKMSYLAEKYGYDVTVVTCYQFEGMRNTYPLSKLVKQRDLIIRSYRQYRYHYPMRLWVKWKYHKLLHKRLQETIDELQPDILVGLTYILADAVLALKTTAKRVIESHEARPFTMSWLQHDNSSWLSKTYKRFTKDLYLHTIERKADAIVTLSNGDAYEWRKARRVEVIPNFSQMKVTALSDGMAKRVIVVGRLDWQKGYDKLLDIWQKVSQRHPDWQLDIYGEGPWEDQLITTIIHQNLRHVAIHPFTPHISEEYAKSSLCLLTSRFEGFSLVLLEAMMHGLPCVTFNCPYGPSDLVDDGENGYVVTNRDNDGFAEKVCYLIEHPEIRAQFSKAAIKKAGNYDMEKTMEKWKSLFESL